LDLRLGSASAKFESLGVTLEHPFWRQDDGWVPAKELRPNDRVWSLQQGWLSVISTRLRHEREPVYNLDVAELNTFAVGELTAWVHNEGCGKRAALRQAKRDANVPTSAQPDATARPFLRDSQTRKVIGPDGQPVKTYQYEYTTKDGQKVLIQDYSAGHAHGEGGVGDQGPHFNVRPPENPNTGKVPGTKAHYEFEKK
ncbi:MAG: HNH/endonuclease VII fold putative polymorphic toxin, partial [Polyangiaceae bacterium]|nr:HNH/endonuclease VII fold putative polymorphic toxin [Polyangiaceae bacterium]